MTVRVAPTRAVDEIVALLIAEGASCVQELPGELVTSLALNGSLSVLEHRIRELDAAAIVKAEPFIDPEFDLHGTVEAQSVGELFVVPSWDANGNPPERTIVIEPGGAFGTGDHPTTRGVLRLMQGAIRPGDVVADLGAGSAILSIVAVVLLDILPVIRRSLATGGRAIVSGILIEERALMLKAFAAGGWSLVREESEGEWWTALVKPQ